MNNEAFIRSLGLGIAPAAYSLGAPQQSGPMTVLPVFGPAPRGKFAPPLSGLKLGGVKRGYGNVELHHSLPEGVAIVPRQMGYIQDRVQNHALCRSAFIAPGQRVVFEDACCVQQAQGGFLSDKEQWFFVLPLALREAALALRGQKSYAKLWPAIARLCAGFGMQGHGHLEQVISRRRPFLTQYQSRFELLPGQTGAIFFLRERLVGVELAPDADYFREVWMPLVCFCYGTAAMRLEQRDNAAGVRLAGRKHRLDGDGFPAGRPPPAVPFNARSLAELRQRLADSRWERQLRLREPLLASPVEPLQLQEEERYLRLRLFTATGRHFVGQIVREGERLVYASVGARSALLESLN